MLSVKGCLVKIIMISGLLVLVSVVIRWCCGVGRLGDNWDEDLFVCFLVLFIVVMMILVVWVVVNVLVRILVLGWGLVVMVMLWMFRWVFIYGLLMILVFYVMVGCVLVRLVIV